MRQCIVDGSAKDSTIPAGFPDVTYVDMSFENFVAREVNIDGVEVGEFHVGGYSIPARTMVNLLQTKISGEVSLIDPEDFLKLEHGIYIKTNIDSMDYMCMIDTLNKVDEIISEKGKYNA